MSSYDCNSINSPYGSALVRNSTAYFVVFVLIFFAAERVVAGIDTANHGDFSIDKLEGPRFEFAAESAYLLGVLGNPHGYEIGAQFVTGRMRLGAVRGDNWLRGYHQAYFSLMAEPIFRGPENYYYGFSMGLRYNFVSPGSRIVPYISGGVGAGAIDSHPDDRGAQGQDFTFNILTAAGVSYRLNARWKVDAGILYQHLSNAGQTSPNPSLNLLGPQFGVTYSF